MRLLHVTWSAFYVRKLIFVFLLISLAGSAIGATPIVPTTTLAAETGNNTSAASTFKTQSNGNIGASNVSKVSIRTLMYPGFNGKIFVHFMPWFGPSNHMNVGYESADRAQVAKQVRDMMSRGIDGALVDWYGPASTHHDLATQYLRDEAAKTGGKFKIAVSYDAGALRKCEDSSTCSVTSKMIADLKYAYNTYITRPEYVTYNGRPLIFFYGIETIGGIDYSRVQREVPGNPIFVWRNGSGFSKPISGGAYGWIGTASSSTDMGLSHLTNFYSEALEHPGKVAVGSGYKGFNDSLAAWSKPRSVNQQCGQTWLATMATAGKYYSAANQLYAVQLNTWNDYEEGSEIESGIDNCVTISGSVSGDTLNWSITGKENTLSYYRVFISLDGQNLMRLTDVPTGRRSLDLKQFALEPDSYTLYVKAVGKPSIVNKMTGAIRYATTNLPPVAKLAVTPSSGSAPITVKATTTGSYDSDGSIASTSINWGDGSTTNAASGSHVYTTGGNYTVTATVTDNTGRSASATRTVSIAGNLPPLAKLSITPGTGVAPVTVSASTAGSTDSDGSITGITINWGNGQVISAASGSYTYTTAGTYTVTATVKDNVGATSKATATVNVTSSSSTTAGVKVSSPAPNSTVSTSVRVAAAATPGAGATITGMRVYVDGVSAYHTSAARLDTYVRMSAGSRRLTVKAWDSKGAVHGSTLTLTVK